MQFISEQDKKRISNAIQTVESKTSGELVTVIARASDNYLYIPVLWAALLTLLLPAPFLFMDITFILADLYLYQLSCFVLLVLLFLNQNIRRHLIPPSVRRHRAHRHAMEQFLLNNLSGTQQSNGILLFVSIAEHYVEIIADKNINDRVESEVWKNIVDDFTVRVRRGEIAEGFLGAIQVCGELLQQHFPAHKDNSNELPDHLVIV